LGANSGKNAIGNSFKSIAKKHGKVTKRLPKWSPNQFQKTKKIDAKTGIEKDQENHENSWFSKRVKP
jgi:hypothetical protein